MGSRAIPRINVFDFVDFRDFLRGYYEREKLVDRSFSYRVFSKRCSFASPNFLKLVIEGKRNLGADSVLRFAKAMGLEEEEQKFFEDLVGFGQAETAADKAKHFEKVAASRRFRAARKIDGPLFEYLSHWYYPAIRELASRKDFRAEAGWISKILRPNVPEKEVEKALDVLFRLGLLVKESGGGVSRGDPSLTTGHQVQAVGVVAFHREMLSRASAAIELIPREERDVSALTVCIRAATVTELKQRIQRFRTELLERCDADDEGEVVYQINLQLFPLSFGEESKP